jgi:hypothetical protein
MTKKLEDILNLPNVKEAFKEVDKKEKDKKLKETANGQVSQQRTWIHRQEEPSRRAMRSLTR